MLIAVSMLSPPLNNGVKRSVGRNSVRPQ